MSEPFLGEIRMFGFNFAPQGWAFCNGQLLAISQNTALFALLGTFYGGDGRTTFALPDLQGRVAVHQGQGPGLSPYVIGEATGQENVALVTSELPNHTHAIAQPANNGAAGQARPLAHVPGRGGAYAASSDGTSTLASFASGATGAGAPHPNLQPLLVVSFCIALQGIFPSRN
jgi:microcystin-dependent protein